MNVVIYGVGRFSSMIGQYIMNDKRFKLLGFTIQKEYILEDNLMGLNVFPYENLKDLHLKKFSIIVAIGYTKLNRVREKIYNQIVSDGYDISSYIHQSVIKNKNTRIGIGNIILENVIIQPNTSIGNSNIFFSNVVVSHDTIIDSFNYFAPSVVISGNAQITSYCFMGSNSTISNGIFVAPRTIVGANALIRKDTSEAQVIVPTKSYILLKKSDEIELK